MIVRCKDCVSAFAVDDEKVANKKFAYTCPKCGSENIVDNRNTGSKKEEPKPQAGESFFNDDFSVDSGVTEKEKNEPSAPEEDFFNEAPEAEKQTKEDDFSSIEDEFPDEFPAEDITDETDKKERKINLEIEEFEDIPGITEEDIFPEKSSQSKKKDEDDILSEIPAFDSGDEIISFDDKEKSKTSSDEFEIELKDDTVKTEEGEEVFFDDFDETPLKKPAKKDDSLTADTITDETDFLFEEPEDTIPEDTKEEREKKLTSQDDIDALFADEGINFEEKPISKERETEFEDEITVDLDMLDIDLEEGSEDKQEKIKPAAAKSEKAADSSDEDITLDIDNLDIDLDESALDTDIFNESAEPEKPSEKHVLSDEDITLDIDNLDIDLDESSLSSDLFTEPAAAKSSKPAAQKTAVPEDENDFNEEDIKLNLEDLDIDLEEIEDRELVFDESLAAAGSGVSRQKAKPVPLEDDEDESITIDLDTLEIEIAEEKSSINAELSEDDEKLTLEDAGLTLDEITSEMKKSDFEEADEDIKLTLNDIDPDLTIEKIAPSGKTEAKRQIKPAEEFPEIDLNEIDLIDIDQDLTADETAPSGRTEIKLPEIDIDEYDTAARRETKSSSDASNKEFEEDFILFPESEIELPIDNKRDYDMFEYEEHDRGKSSTKRGNTFFSIDFSLKYSRLGALLRLLGLYMLSMISHFIVFFIYSSVSAIVGFINQIVILSTGRCVEDFAILIENTMRYYFYIQTCMSGIVEDRPVYTGRETIDHPLQLNITYPLKYSKNLALLRLSIIGIMIITVPHMIIMSLLTLTIPVVYLAGIISVIITKRWPNILFIYITKYFRYMARISAFLTGLTDEYPTFRFD